MTFKESFKDRPLSSPNGSNHGSNPAHPHAAQIAAQASAHGVPHAVSHAATHSSSNAGQSGLSIGAGHRDPSLPVSAVQEPLSRTRRGEQIPSKKIIRELGLKVTNQRLLILDVVRGGPNHFTAQDVFENVSSKNDEIGFATVYRFLRTLSEQSYVTEVRMGGMPARYEWAAKHHHDHLTCTECSKIVEFENTEIERLQQAVAREFQFTLTHHVLELYGTCRECALKAKSK